MNPIMKKLELSRAAYYEAHLNIINGILPIKLTPKEVEVLARFMSFEGEITGERFGTSARKLVKESLKLSDGGLSNYMKSLTQKGYLLLADGRLTLNELLIISDKEQGYMFKIVNTDNITSHDS